MRFTANKNGFLLSSSISSLSDLYSFDALYFRISIFAQNVGDKEIILIPSSTFLAAISL
jgi:hypothetical protein